MGGVLTLRYGVGAAVGDGVANVGAALGDVVGAAVGDGVANVGAALDDGVGFTGADSIGAFVGDLVKGISSQPVLSAFGC